MIDAAREGKYEQTMEAMDAVERFLKRAVVRASVRRTFRGGVCDIRGSVADPDAPAHFANFS
jgi:hypothetical protein